MWGCAISWCDGKIRASQLASRAASHPFGIILLHHNSGHNTFTRFKFNKQVEVSKRHRTKCRKRNAFDTRMNVECCNHTIDQWILWIIGKSMQQWINQSIMIRQSANQSINAWSQSAQFATTEERGGKTWKDDEERRKNLKLPIRGGGAALSWLLRRSRSQVRWKLSVVSCGLSFWQPRAIHTIVSTWRTCQTALRLRPHWMRRHCLWLPLPCLWWNDALLLTKLQAHYYGLLLPFARGLF